jgi:hypothetical protein
VTPRATFHHRLLDTCCAAVSDALTHMTGTLRVCEVRARAPHM